MSVINEISLAHFRNIDAATFQLTPHFNFFYGKNGAGKTSIVESIYYLAHGRSFRSSRFSALIQHNETNFSIFMRLDGGKHTLGLLRGVQERYIRINENNAATLSELVRHVPAILLSTQSYQFYTHGPKVRRQYLDWMLFHVEPNFYPLWRDYQGLLQQRNRALKLRLSSSEVFAWENEIVVKAIAVDQLRQKIVESFSPIFNAYITKLLPKKLIYCQYYSGWQGDDFQEVLSANLQRDYQLGYTELGPHRADFCLMSMDEPVSDLLSQGQQKVAVFGLQLAMGDLLQQLRQVTPIFLLDDLASELDSENRQKVVVELGRLSAQVIVTGIELNELRDAIAVSDAKVFHVERGEVKPLEAIKT